MQGVANGVGIFVDPGLVIFECDGVDDQCVSLPTTKLFAKERCRADPSRCSKRILNREYFSSTRLGRDADRACGEWVSAD
jgi:hypothetical protein